MSERHVTPQHDQGDWRRWQMDELGTQAREQRQRDRSRQDAIRRQALQRAAELEEERDKARREAYDAAYAEGLEQGRQVGYDQGLAEGRAAGEAEMQEQTRETLAPLQPLATRFGEALKALDGEIAERLLDLALATGRQLAGEALEAHPEQVLEILRELLHAEPALSGRPRLWLNPEDLTLVSAQLGDEFDAAGWQLQPDDQITRGGCRVTSASGEFDATFEARWAAIAGQVRRRQPASTGDAS